MSSIDKHLGSNEKVIMRFRPSRKSFLGEYIMIIILMLFAFGFFMTIIMTALAYMILVASLILLIKTEYKIWSKAYAITDARVMMSEGIFTERFKSCVYSNITNLGLKQSFFDKIMNTGTISIDTAGSDSTELILRRISRPFEVKKKISDMQSTATQQQTRITHHNPTLYKKR
jgi:uncharacterized membrane protein YdbT with pleckstrin-like domain